MWKIVVGFIVFAAIAMYVIVKGGDSLDMSGEKHDAGSHAPAPAAAPATPAAPAATPAAPAAPAAAEPAKKP